MPESLPQKPPKSPFFRARYPCQNIDADARPAQTGRDGLLDNGIRFQDGDGRCLGGEAIITDEGREFLRLIENDGVWHLVTRTLDAAGVDVPVEWWDVFVPPFNQSSRAHRVPQHTTERRQLQHTRHPQQDQVSQGARQPRQSHQPHGRHHRP